MGRYFKVTVKKEHAKESTLNKLNSDLHTLFNAPKYILEEFDNLYLPPFNTIAFLKGEVAYMKEVPTTAIGRWDYETLKNATWKTLSKDGAAFGLGHAQSRQFKISAASSEEPQDLKYALALANMQEHPNYSHLFEGEKAYQYQTKETVLEYLEHECKERNINPSDYEYKATS